MPFTLGLPETACGIGSTVDFTEHVRAQLPPLFSELEVRVLLDAPCGDFNWMSRCDLSQVHYIGIDYDEQHLQAAMNRSSEPAAFAPKSKTIMLVDMCDNHLPEEADMMLCRDFLQHLPNAAAMSVLNNFVASDIPWLLATSHDNPENVDIEKHGMFRPLNLLAAPFSLPSPHRHIADGVGRILGLWHRDEVRE